MKKTIGIILLSMILVLGLVGCGNSVATEAVKQGKEALQKKEYDKALLSFDIVLDNDAKNKEAAILKSIINDYLTAKKYLEQGKTDEAKKTIEGVNTQYSEYPIKDDIDILKKQIEEVEKTNKVINDEIEKLIILYNDKKYDDGKKLISELSKYNLNSKQNEEINNINIKIEEEQKKTEEEQKKTTEKENIKQSYIEKLDNIELGLEDLAELYAGSMMEMKRAAAEEYSRWDDALNEIYGVLKTELSATDMSKLQEEQIQWISDKENKAKTASLEFKGGTMEGLVYTSSLGKTTKDRCYELVEKYMSSK